MSSSHGEVIVNMAKEEELKGNTAEAVRLYKAGITMMLEEYKSASIKGEKEKEILLKINLYMQNAEDLKKRLSSKTTVPSSSSPPPESLAVSPILSKTSSNTEKHSVPMKPLGPTLSSKTTRPSSSPPPESPAVSPILSKISSNTEIPSVLVEKKEKLTPPSIPQKRRESPPPIPLKRESPPSVPQSRLSDNRPATLLPPKKTLEKEEKNAEDPVVLNNSGIVGLLEWIMNFCLDLENIFCQNSQNKQEISMIISAAEQPNPAVLQHYLSQVKDSSSITTAIKQYFAMREIPIFPFKTFNAIVSMMKRSEGDSDEMLLKQLPPLMKEIELADREVLADLFTVLDNIRSVSSKLLAYNLSPSLMWPQIITPRRVTEINFAKEGIRLMIENPSKFFGTSPNIITLKTISTNSTPPMLTITPPRRPPPPPIVIPINKVEEVEVEEVAIKMEKNISKGANLLSGLKKQKSDRRMDPSRSSVWAPPTQREMERHASANFDQWTRWHSLEGHDAKSEVSNIKQQAILPEDNDKNEWLAAHILDFYTETMLVWNSIKNNCSESSCPIMCAGSKIEYQWIDPFEPEITLKLNGNEYVDKLSGWIDSITRDPKIFPIDEKTNFPSNFEYIITHIFRKLFRVFAHVYKNHWPSVVEMKAEYAIESVFQVFIIFGIEFKLLPEKEMAPLAELIKLVSESTLNERKI